jgi:hypothetical protein
MDIRKLAEAIFGIAIYVMSTASQADTAPVQPADGNALDAVILISGQEAGTYREHTVYGVDQVEDTVDQRIAINRLGSSVEILSKEVSFQDTKGHLISGHFETTSSKSTVNTDLVVQPHAIALKIHSGDRTYNRTLPFAGDLLGPEGIRLMLANPGSCEQGLHYWTYSSALNDVMEVALKCISAEPLMIEGVNVPTRRLEMRASGIAAPWTLWVDHEGRTVRMLQDSPFGPVETERRYGTGLTHVVGATLAEQLRKHSRRIEYSPASPSRIERCHGRADQEAT